ncbi:MATE family efflux transporter [Rheinheimera baltica]|uniref:MATE family efflux transporter n=1 Tax=Rheinheimera baltica TaxID=67576 RepID=A0ABT9I4H9_9GAMM|nr:MATE family efflux transporter [Rheinheimera baltica]MDP5138290.1 MATE family efflux transporter [Rheinheimera baltica]
MTSQNMRQENPEHKLTPSSLESEKLRNLYVKIALPMAFGMVLSGLYNMVDAYFIAQYVGDIGFAAVSAIFPLQMLVIALGAFISNGVSIVVSQYWGAGQNSKAQTVINNAFTLVLLLSIVLAILVLSATSPLLRSSGVTDLLFDDARAYFIPVTMGAVLVLSLSLITDLLRAQTKMQSLLLIIILGAVSNVILVYCRVQLWCQWCCLRNDNMPINGAITGHTFIE